MSEGYIDTHVQNVVQCIQSKHAERIKGEISGKLFPFRRDETREKNNEAVLDVTCLFSPPPREAQLLLQACDAALYIDQVALRSFPGGRSGSVKARVWSEHRAVPAAELPVCARLQGLTLIDPMTLLRFVKLFEGTDAKRPLTTVWRGADLELYFLSYFEYEGRGRIFIGTPYLPFDSTTWFIGVRE